MTISRDLFLAILSMDSYNRDYGFGVKISGATIGGARILSRDGLQITQQQYESWQAAGFYAIAYDVSGAGISGLSGTVISYRGSDYQDTRGISARSNDIWQGWTAATGFPFGRQPQLALEFYRAVTGSEPYNTPGNYTITGHSLGGSLAGFVSAVSGNRAVLFDHIPFGIAAHLQTLYATGSIANVRHDLPTAYHVQGEVAGLARVGNLSYLAALPVGALTGLAGWAFAGSSLADITAEMESDVQNSEITSGNDIANLGAINLHSQSLLVTLLWARDNADANWFYASKDLLTSYFSETVARSLPRIQKFRGEITSSGYAMQSAIAYSALDEGERPFGDVAIRAMFDDAADLGTALRYNFMPGWGGSLVNDAVGRVLVEYAGLMALRDVEAFGALANPANAAALGGVLSLDVPEGQAEGQAFPEALRINFGADRWAIGGGVVGGMHQSVQRDYLVSSLLLAAGSDSELSRLERWYSGESGGADLTETIDEAIFAFGSNPQIEPSDAEGIALMVTGDGGVTTQSAIGQSFRIGGSGFDTLTGGADIDILCLGSLRQCIEARAAANDNPHFQEQAA